MKNDAAPKTLSRSTIWSVHTGRLPLVPYTPNALVFTNLYAVSLNLQTRFADWVGYRVTAASQSGRNSLNRNWLHRGKAYTIEAQDYEGSGYSMGHLCPLASVRADADAWEVNWTGVVAPQRQALNAGPWLDFENHTRELAREHGEVYVLCGTLYRDPMPELPNSDEAHTVPSHFWSRIYVPATDEVTAWLMPQDAPRKTPHTEYVIHGATLIRETGYVFFDEY